MHISVTYFYSNLVEVVNKMLRSSLFMGTHGLGLVYIKMLSYDHCTVSLYCCVLTIDVKTFLTLFNTVFIFQLFYFYKNVH